MKKMKKILCLALALVMVMALGMSAWAVEGDETGDTEPTTPNLTVGMKVNTHDFLVYQLLVGTVTVGANGEAVLDTDANSGLAWGAQLTDDTIRANFLSKMAEKYSEFEGVTTPAQLAQALYEIEQRLGNGRTETELNPRAALAAFAKDMHDILADGYTGESELEQTADRTVDRDTGYYLLIDEDDSVADDSLKYLLFALSETNNTVNPKTKDTPDMEKKVKKNGSDEYDTWAEYEIGDDVPFEITATLPDGYEAKKATYWMTFKDTQEDGLGAPENIEVYAVKVNPDGTETETKLNYNVAGTNNEYALTTTAHGFTIELTNMGTNDNLANLTDGDKIIVRYTAELLDGAVLAGAGNANTAELEYEDGSTPPSTVKVFTFEFDANKVDGTDGNKPLKGAAFSLYKKLGDIPANVNDDMDDEALQALNYRADRNAEGNIVTVYELVESFVAGETTTFAFEGLTTGEYRLYEDTPPTGYTPIDPIDFTLEAEYNNTHTEVTKLEMKKESGNVVDNGDGDASNGEGVIAVPIANYKGTVLPETGGIGTTMFYIGGAVLLLGAVVLLVTRRRAKYEDD